MYLVHFWKLYRAAQFYAKVLVQVNQHAEPLKLMYVIYHVPVANSNPIYSMRKMRIVPIFYNTRSE